MNDYGDFINVINNLDSSLEEVRRVWTDKTASSFDHMNDNMKHFGKKIWECKQNSKEAYEAVKANYDEDEFQSIVDQICSKASTV